MHKQYGYNAIEIMLCLVISTLLLCSALPQLKQLKQRTQEVQWTNQLLGHIHYARSQAVFSKAHVSLCSGLANCNQQPNWHEQLLAFIDRNGNGRLEAEDQLIRTLALPTDAHWRWSAPLNKTHLTYQADGTTKALNGTFTLCHKGQPLQQIKISISGRARTQPSGANSICN